MAHRIIENEELYSLVRTTARMFSRTVGSTIGPNGSTVVLPKSFGAPEITKDGYKVAKQIKPEKPEEKDLVELFVQATSNANDESGDGTTTSALIVGHLVNESHRYLISQCSRAEIDYGIKTAKDYVIKYLKEEAQSISSKDEIAKVATVSANGDKSIGEKIAEAMEKVGKEGVISVEEGKGTEKLVLEWTEGMMFDRGYISPYFATNHEKMEAELENPYVLIVNKKLSTIQPLVNVLEAVFKSGRPLLIIAEDVEGEALTSLVLNRLKSGLKVAAVKAPGFGERRAEILEDIKILTNASYVVSDEIGIKLEDIVLHDLGTARRVHISKDYTTIVEGGGDQDDIKKRIAQIKIQISNTKSDYEREKLQERLAKLAGGVAVLKVGGSTEVEVKELKDRVDDAVQATRAAVEEGIVTGGGAALLYASLALEQLRLDTEDQRIGVEIVKRALVAPIRQIIENSYQEPAVIIDYLIKQKDKRLLFNAATLKYVDAFKDGILDPVKVVRIALETAVSVASTLITTKTMIVEIPNKDDNSNMGNAGGAGGMGAGGF